VHGKAFDPSGAVIVGASVTARNIVSEFAYYVQGTALASKGFRFRVTRWFKRQHHFLDHVQLTQLNGSGELRRDLAASCTDSMLRLAYHFKIGSKRPARG
jgi:hypothetical protein